MRTFFVVALIIFSGTIAAEPVIVKQPAGTDCWIVFLPGSGCGIFEPQSSRWIQWLRSVKPYGVLAINKAGAMPDGTCSQDEYQRSSVRQQRIADIQAALQKQLPAQAKVLLIGESEGGYIAPDIAAADSRVKSMILLSAGTRSWIEELVNLSPVRERAGLQKFFNEKVIGNNSLSDFYDDTSYAQLNSYHLGQTLNPLKALQIPILMINGGQDRHVWVGGVIQDLRRLRMEFGKKNIQHRIFPELNHSLECAVSSCDGEKVSRQLRDLVQSFVRENTIDCGL